ncbi:MAG: hypothetical protein JKY54_17295 [Flavobacteriales bacterium]|nr:hypothetical protein [Flavobacteriales bacterium]
MKKIFLPVVAASALLFSACGEVTTTEEPTTHEEPAVAEPVVATYTVDAAASTLSWNGYDVAMPEGHFHKGTVAISAGTITTTDGMVDGGTITIDMTTVGYTEGGGQDGPISSADTAVFSGLLGHIATNEIFNTTAITTATLTINSCDEAGIKGTLNVLGTDVEVVIPGMPSLEGDALTHTTDWFDVDLSSAVGFFGTPEGAEGPAMKLSIKLNLTASK